MERSEISAGTQAGQYIVPMVSATWKRHSAVSDKIHFRPKDRQLPETFDAYVKLLDRSWGLFVSLCTGMVARVRIRDLISFLYRQGLKDRSSLTQFGLLGDDFVAVLEGTTNLNDWVYDTGKSAASDGEEGKKCLREQIQNLILDIIPRLLSTGIDHNRNLNIAWAFNYPTEKMILDHNLHNWIPVLADTSEACTIAVVFDCCFQASGCNCSGESWKPPASFKLSTKVAFYTKTDRKMVPQSTELVLGKSYWINDKKLGLIAEVKEATKGDRPISLAVRQSVIISIRKYLSAYFLIREENDESLKTWNCIVGS
jgi:hypothetical protein